MFKNRKDAGIQLAETLQQYKNKDVLVLAIPRGGVEVAFYVAEELNASLSLIISRKLGYPYNPEAAFGAIAEDGSTYLSEFADKDLGEATIEEVIEAEKNEITRRIQKLRKGADLPDFTDKIIIIVDDGIATGATLFSTISLCKKKNPKRIVIAAPVSSREMVGTLTKEVDEVHILETPKSYWAVSQAYEEFTNLTDSEVLDIMRQWEDLQKQKSKISETQ